MPEATFLVASYCHAARSVIGLPDRPNSHLTSSEQSNFAGSTFVMAAYAPSTYGLPTWASASFANCAAVIEALQGVSK